MITKVIVNLQGIIRIGVPVNLQGLQAVIITSLPGHQQKVILSLQGLIQRVILNHPDLTIPILHQVGPVVVVNHTLHPHVPVQPNQVVVVQPDHLVAVLEADADSKWI